MARQNFFSLYQWVVVILLVAILVVGVSLLVRVGGNERSTETEQSTETELTAGTIAGHDYVDLGLSVKWATCNVGASSPSAYGNYYAWGETTTKSEYTESNSKTYGKNFGDISGNPQYDAARANWGGSWRLPTQKECQELVDKCVWTWRTIDGHNGYKVTSKTNANSIFLPAAGWHLGSSSGYVGESGIFWNSTPFENYEGTTQYAYDLYFGSGRHYVGCNYRYLGLSVRPVSE